MSNERHCEQYALKLLAGRPLSERELKRRLVLRDYGPDAADKVITVFLEHGYLDDNKLCRNLFDKYAASGKYGLNAIIARLRKRELPDAIINGVVKDYNLACDYELAVEIVNRRWRRRQPGDLAKIGRFLSARGFTPDTVGKVLEKLNLNDWE